MLDPHDGSGKAVAVTPKLLLDALVRKNLENILQQKYGRFPISYFQDNLLDRVMDGSLEITAEMIKLNVLNSDSSANTEHSIYTSYSVGFPQVYLHLSDCKRLILVFDETRPKIVLQCLSRTSRDLIVMALRVFSIETYLLHSKAIENISSGQPPFGKKIELALEIDEVLVQMGYLVQQNAELKMERSRYKKELRDMEKEMENTIEAYRTLLDCNNLDQRSGVDEELQKIKNELNDAIENKRKTRVRVREKDEEIKGLCRQIEEMKESQQNLVWELKASKDSLIEPDFSVVESRLKEAEHQIAEKDRKCVESAEEADRWKRRISELEEGIKERVVENQTLKGEIVEHTSLLQELAQYKNQNEALLGQRSILSKKIEGLTSELNELQVSSLQEKTANRENMQILEEENRRLKLEIETSREEHKTETDSSLLKQAQEDVVKYRQQCDNLAAQLSRMQAQLRKANK